MLVDVLISVVVHLKRLQTMVGLSEERIKEGIFCILTYLVYSSNQVYIDCSNPTFELWLGINTQDTIRCTNCVKDTINDIPCINFVSGTYDILLVSQHISKQQSKQPKQAKAVQSCVNAIAHWLFIFKQAWMQHGQQQ